MRNPTVTDRDRELAEDLIHKFQPEHDTMEPWEIVEYLEQRFAQARREGWEEGLREALTEAQHQYNHFQHIADDPRRAAGARFVEKRITALLDQPAPEGAKE